MLTVLWGRETTPLVLLCELSLLICGLWQRRRKSMDVPRKMLCNDFEYNGDIPACGVYPVGKSRQQLHPKQATYDAQLIFELVVGDTMGPIIRQALDRCNYGTNVYQSAYEG